MDSRTTRPARIAEYSPTWPAVAAEWLEQIHRALAALPGHEAFVYEHIGSTSVPGLAAKPIIDLQVRMPELPSEEEASRALSPLGVKRAFGSRPDSPGVYSDARFPDPAAEPGRYSKLLFQRPATKYEPELIVHIRRQDSPFAEFVVDFRDWLRADHENARRYEAIKRDLAEQFADEADYDDYTRAKTKFIARAFSEMKRPQSFVLAALPLNKLNRLGR